MDIDEIEKELDSLYSQMSDRGIHICQTIDWMKKYAYRLITVAKHAKKAWPIASCDYDDDCRACNLKQAVGELEKD